MSPIDVERLVAIGDSTYQSPPELATFADGHGVDLSVWDREANALDVARAGQPDDSPFEGTRLWMRAAAVDTGAIEDLYTTDRGFTVSVAEGLLAVEAMEVEKGPQFRVHFESQLAGLEMALDAATSERPVNETWLRELHANIVAGQETYNVHTAEGVAARALPKGEYKSEPNHVLLAEGNVFSYAPVSETAREVSSLVGVLRSDDFTAAHPAVQAAYAHYALVRVHPFADGNGRVCRALASVYTLRSVSLPLVVFADEKDRYLSALRSADDGRFADLIRFVRDQLISTMRSVTATLNERSIDPEDVAQIRDVYIAPNGYPNSRLDELATELQGLLEDLCNAELDRADLPAEAGRGVRTFHASGFEPPENWRFRTDGTAPAVTLSFRPQPPLSGDPSVAIYVLVGTGSDAIDGFSVCTNERLHVVTLSVIEAQRPTSAKRRLQPAVRSVVAQLIGKLEIPDGP